MERCAGVTWSKWCELAGLDRDVWAYGCKHLASAEALFERREVEASPGSCSALLLIAVKTAGLFGW